MAGDGGRPRHRARVERHAPGSITNFRVLPSMSQHRLGRVAVELAMKPLMKSQEAGSGRPASRPPCGRARPARGHGRRLRSAGCGAPCPGRSRPRARARYRGDACHDPRSGCCSRCSSAARDPRGSPRCVGESAGPSVADAAESSAITSTIGSGLLRAGRARCAGMSSSGIWPILVIIKTLIIHKKLEKDSEFGRSFGRSVIA